jgi:sigma-B regulation protein RsbU (phosphoserine phosphatase)
VYASAGHPPGYVLDPSGKVKTLLKSTGIPLGILADRDFPAAPPLPLEPGDLVFLLTDGIVEANADDETFFGVERALEVVRANRDRSAREIVHTLYGTVRDFCRDRDQLDDMTAIVIKVEPDTGQGPAPRGPSQGPYP